MLRRSFLSRFGGAAAFFGVTSPGLHESRQNQLSQPEQPAQPARSAQPFQAARHSQDDWFDQVPGTHRVIFDTWMADRFAEAVGFAGNYVRVNKDVYGLSEKDVAVVICVRHRTAPFAFTDAMWAKYGKQFSARMSFVDPKTQQAPTTNVYGAQISNLAKQGVQLAVCNLTTRAYTRIIADAIHGDADEIYKELTANTIAVSHFVPAGVVAVTRAQEHGYALVAIG
jgi:intracellular sulfur oxidation DsrE/DsrF family protein